MRQDASRLINFEKGGGKARVDGVVPARERERERQGNLRNASEIYSFLRRVIKIVFLLTAFRYAF